MSEETAGAEKAHDNKDRQRGKVSKVPGVQLDIPLGKEVVVRVPGLDQSYRGKMVGSDPYDYIIASVRLPSAVRKKLAMGGQVVVKYVSKGNVYGFRSNTLNAITTPSSLLFIAYPDVIEKITLRETSRMECNIDGVLESIDDKHDCIVVNVSESGCRISARAGTRDPLTQTKVGETMAISMTLGNFGTIKTPVAIRNTEIEKGIITMGAMFLDIQQEEVAIIRQYLDKLERFAR